MKLYITILFLTIHFVSYGQFYGAYPPTATKTYDPANKGSLVTLSNGNLTEAVSANSSVITTVRCAAGENKSFEIKINSYSSNWCAGFANSSFSGVPSHIGDNLGRFIDSWGVENFSGTMYFVTNNALTAISGSPHVIIAGETLLINLDCTISGGTSCTVKAYWSQAGTTTLLNGGAIFTGLTPPLYPASGSASGAANNETITLIAPFLCVTLPNSSTGF